MRLAEDEGASRGMVFDIERFAVHDGPGIRSLVFFKGCPLKCWWCANPEGQNPRPEIGYGRNNCVACRRCVSVCPTGAISDSRERIDRQRCIVCGACASVCPSAALTVIGRELSVPEVMATVRRDAAFYRRSGGGVTVSGGEPLMQSGFLMGLLMALKAHHTTTAIETSGFCGEAALKRVLPWLDLLLYDIKHMDDSKHQEGTGVSNSTILHNARIAAVSGVKVILRVPVIPGYNDSVENIRATAEFARELGLREMHLLPYHRLGVTKYEKLGIKYKPAELSPPSSDQMMRLKNVVMSTGLVCSVGGA